MPASPSSKRFWARSAECPFRHPGIRARAPTGFREHVEVLSLPTVRKAPVRSPGHGSPSHIDFAFAVDDWAMFTIAPRPTGALQAGPNRLSGKTLHIVQIPYHASDLCPL